MGAKNAKEALYSSIERSDESMTARILKVRNIFLITQQIRTVFHLINIKMHPELLNSPITDDCFNTALTRSTWRNDKKLVTLLLGVKQF